MTYDLRGNARDMGAVLANLATKVRDTPHVDQYPDAHATFLLGCLLTDLNNVRTYADDCLVEVVREMRSAGATWREVGDALNISKQAAQQRFR